ncbi:MAG: NADH-quinone oxidoreductase subunit C [Alphaproteobacteria bacterium]|nr:NADH-quinone oxidoreductase subunit C [Alphaproteobacteria bacterium]
MTAIESLIDLCEHVAESMGEQVLSHEMVKDEPVLTVKRESICKVLQFLRDDPECQFKQLVSICGVDYPERAERFEVVYNLLSMSQNNRIRVKLATTEEKAVPTATKIFSTAGWFEREAWDLYGIYFEGHTDLRRILTDYGFEGHPLRKDFPLTGYVELRYDESERRVVYEPVKLTQDFRTFDYLSPWEGMTDVQLPGDEKGTVPEHGWEEADKSLPTSKAAKGGK